MKKELSMLHGTLNIFFSKKTFFVCQDRNLKFLASVGYCETLQNFSSLRQTFRRVLFLILSVPCNMDSSFFMAP